MVGQPQIIKVRFIPFWEIIEIGDRPSRRRSGTSAAINCATPTPLVNARVSLQGLMALLGHSSAEWSLRYGRLFDSTVRQEDKRANPSQSSDRPVGPRTDRHPR